MSATSQHALRMLNTTVVLHRTCAHLQSSSVHAAAAGRSCEPLSATFASAPCRQSKHTTCRAAAVEAEVSWGVGVKCNTTCAATRTTSRAGSRHFEAVQVAFTCVTSPLLANIDACTLSRRAASKVRKSCGRCTILGCPGGAAPDLTDALLGFGAAASWIEENSSETRHHPVDDSPREEPEPQAGPSPFWLKQDWRNCKIVALFDCDMPQVPAILCMQCKSISYSRLRCRASSKCLLPLHACTKPHLCSACASLAADQLHPKVVNTHSCPVLMRRTMCASH